MEELKKSQIAEEIFSEAEKNHLNLFHHITKQDFEMKKKELLKNADNMTDIEFDAVMLRLFAIIKNDHSSYYHKTDYLDHENLLVLVDGKVYIPIESGYAEIVKINGIAVAQVISKFSELINYETQGWLSHVLKRSMLDLNMYKMTGMVKKTMTEIDIQIKQNGCEKTIRLSHNKNMTDQQAKPELPYDFNIANGVLYVRYSACKEDTSYPFKQLVDDVKKQSANGIVTSAILDVRDNTGGNSEILNPLQEYLNRLKVPVAVLINRGTFSSGRFAVARFKKHLNAILIGEPTGGAAKSYGYHKPMNVGDYKFSVATRLWDFSNTFGYEGAILPDIYVSNTINDVQLGRDRVLEKAKEVLSSQNQTLSNQISQSQNLSG